MQGLRQIGETISELDLDAMMGLMDVDGDGSIDYREFVKVGQMKDELADMQEVRKPPSHPFALSEGLPRSSQNQEREREHAIRQLALVGPDATFVGGVSRCIRIGGAAEQRRAIGAAGLARPGEMRGADRESGATVGREVAKRHGAGARQLAVRLGVCCRCLVPSVVMGMC